MVSSQIHDIINSKNISVGKKISAIGFLRRGAPAEEIVAVEKEIAKVKDWYLSELVILDFSQLEELDSIGIRNTIPHIITYNKELIKKGRFPISIIGNKDSDVFYAVKDKFPDENLDNVLPWYPSEEAYIKAADID